MYVHRLDALAPYYPAQRMKFSRAQNRFPQPPFHHLQCVLHIHLFWYIYIYISAHFHWLRHDIFSQNPHINASDLHTRPASSSPLFSFICAYSKCCAAKNPPIIERAEGRFSRFSATITCNSDHFCRFCKIWHSIFNFRHTFACNLFYMMISLRFFIVPLHFNIRALSF